MKRIEIVYQPAGYLSTMNKKGFNGAILKIHNTNK